MNVSEAVYGHGIAPQSPPSPHGGYPPPPPIPQGAYPQQQHVVSQSPHCRYPPLQPTPQGAYPQQQHAVFVTPPLQGEAYVTAQRVSIFPMIQSPPPDRLCLTLIVSLFCNPIGIVAIVLNIMAQSAWRRGDYGTAECRSQWTCYFILIAVGLGLLTLGLTLHAGVVDITKNDPWADLD